MAHVVILGAGLGDIQMAYDEIKGLGPEGGFAHSVCRTEHAMLAAEAWKAFGIKPVKSGAKQVSVCGERVLRFDRIVIQGLKIAGKLGKYNHKRPCASGCNSFIDAPLSRPVRQAF